MIVHPCAYREHVMNGINDSGFISTKCKNEKCFINNSGSAELVLTNCFSRNCNSTDGVC